MSTGRMVGTMAAVLLCIAGPWVGGAASVAAQAADEREVVAVVERLFQGMLARDTAMMRSTMSPAAQMLGRSQDGQTLRWGSVDAFLQAIGRNILDLLLLERGPSVHRAASISGFSNDRQQCIYLLR